MTSQGVKQSRVVRLEVKVPTATMLKALWMANMSKGTMSIETDKEIPPGAPVRVALMLPGKEIELRALAKASTPHKGGKGFFVAVQFENLEGRERQAIEAIIGTVRDFRIPPPVRKEFEDDDSDIDLGEDS